MKEVTKKNLKIGAGVGAGLFVVSSYLMYKTRLRERPTDTGKWDPIRNDNPISSIANSVILAVNPGA